MIEAIIFDIGGVLWHPTGVPVSNKWAARCGLTDDAFDDILKLIPRLLLIGRADGQVRGDTIGEIAVRFDKPRCRLHHPTAGFIFLNLGFLFLGEKHGINLF
jgi:hypothetical protein